MSNSIISATPQICQESAGGNSSKSENALLPLLEPPGGFEACGYYWGFPSNPRLLGRTSSGTTPWWRLSEVPDDPRSSPFSNLKGESVCGPVGPHAIHACWRVSTLNRVRKALSGLPWSSIDVLRIGRAKLKEHERPVIVWVGVSSNVGYKMKNHWDLIASKLRAVRAALDADNLTDVECEMRESDILSIADAGPRLLLPSHGRDCFDVYEGQAELAAFQAVSAAVGQAITPTLYEFNTGTLGLFLADESEAGDDSDGCGTVWALTCHHVAFSVISDPAEQNVAMVLPAKLLRDTLEFEVDPHISRLERSIAKHKLLSCQTSDDLDYRDSHRQLKLYQGLHNVLSSFQSSDAARTLGHVHHSPPMSVKLAGTEDAFLSDWALIKLDRKKFPNGYGFENVVDVQSNRCYQPCCKDSPPTNRFFCDTLLRLQGTVPVKELLDHSSSSVIADHDGCRNVVMKRGYGTRLSAGMVLDVESVVRHCFDGIEEESYELAVMHLSDPPEIDSHLSCAFAACGDSGAVVFDLKGRIVGMLTSGSGNTDWADCSYVTPIAKLQSDIEQTIGRRVRIL
ncbi:hypothetical protein SEPCBS57363_004340 [Sporothrix epigloea]|uniref:Uncharacterized protein n=1 Tax=Sporothrix epigloea TaxID=1892477 RepID=A0ABP0DTB2_9PEZI